MIELFLSYLPERYQSRSKLVRVTMRVPRRSTIALATAGALASTGTAYLGARNLLVGQATQARTVIPKSWDIPPRADGVYTRGGGPGAAVAAGHVRRPAPDDLR